jgi:MFS transporter, DHA1 family, multidrug resistance protein
MPAPETRRILLLGAVVALAPLSIDLYLPALPAIQAHYGASAASAQLTLSTYFLGLAFGQLVYGPVSDRIGRRAPLLFGLALYVLAALGCAAAPNVDSLIALRLLQALGGCAGMVIVRAVVRDLYPPQEMARVLSSLMLVMGIAPILAPMVGGLIFVAFGWQATFLSLALYGSLVFLLVHQRLRETLHTAGDPLQFGVILRSYGRMLRHRRFMGYALAGGVAQAGLFAYIAVSSFVFIGIYQLSPTAYGLLFGLNAFGLILGSQLNNRLLRRMRSEWVLRRALEVYAASGLLLLLCASTGWGGFVGIVVPLFICISALGFTFPNSTAVALAPFGDRAGLAAALLGTLQYGLAALASAGLAQLHDGTPVPMALGIAGCGVAGVLLLRLMVSEKRL